MLHSNLKQAFSYKLRPEIITNYDKNLLQITAALLQITAKIYYKLLQKIITNYGSFYFCKIQNYYKLLQVFVTYYHNF